MREYKTKRFTISVDHRESELDAEYQRRNQIENDFKTVRIYANLWTVDWCGSSELLLAAASGFESKSNLMKRARLDVAERLCYYKENAQAIVDF